MMTLQEFYHKALDIPFKEQGRDYTGADCWGLIVLAYRDLFGITLPSNDEYYKDVKNYKELAEALSHREGWLPTEAPVTGDVVLFNLSGRPFHIGLMVDEYRFLHLDLETGATLERVDSTLWKKRVEGFYRHVERAD